jgi:hypothetical protein
MTTQLTSKFSAYYRHQKCRKCPQWHPTGDFTSPRAHYLFLRSTFILLSNLSESLPSDLFLTNFWQARDIRLGASQSWSGRAVEVKYPWSYTKSIPGCLARNSNHSSHRAIPTLISHLKTMKTFTIKMYHSNIHLSSNSQLCKHERKGHTPVRDDSKNSYSSRNRTSRGPAISVTAL